MENISQLIASNNSFVDLDRELYKELFGEEIKQEGFDRIRIVVKPSKTVCSIHVAGFKFNQTQMESQWFYCADFSEGEKLKAVFDEFISRSENPFGIVDANLPPENTFSVRESLFYGSHVADIGALEQTHGVLFQENLENSRNERILNESYLSNGHTSFRDTVEKNLNGSQYF